jgi:glycosyltransferase involved in cell wall biosynthesis
VRIYHLSSAPFTGGAARAGFRLHEGLLQEPGIESTWLNAGPAAGEAVQVLKMPTRKISLPQRMRRRIWAHVVSQTFCDTNNSRASPYGWGTVEMLENLPTPDVWNLHWVAGFLEWEKMLPWLAERAPIVWTLHDMNPLRGVWSYEPESWELNRKRAFFEMRAERMKRLALSKLPTDRLTFVGPSRWMVEQCKRSNVSAGFRAEHIPYGLNTKLFSPRPSEPFRTTLGIPQDAFLIGLIADHFQDRRKGMKEFQEILQPLAKLIPTVHLISVGNGTFESGDLPHVRLGTVHDDDRLACFYSACDLFVCPSRQDNLPNTALEASCCGTPVVAHRVGGLIDIVGEGQNGELAGLPGDHGALLDAVLRCHGRIRSGDLRSSAIRSCAVRTYALAAPVERYKALYHKMIAG